jgi:lipopolysaccharide transport system ATP-binding protein
MSNHAITVEGLGKRYRIGTFREKNTRFGPALLQAALAPLHNLKRLRRLSSFRQDDDQDVIWALRDVSFEVRHGECLGVIGRNGAGKSTLLKVLSQIAEPTTGRAKVWGRVGALLEVGTGFHPELTGRENIYLNGSILGMDRAHIARKFDEIVAFAGVERFIDTPVKRYSSGMHLRLGFAVAAQLEPEILIVDEVLAVGDAEFQRKCLGKMNDVTGEGRTVIFVTHNMSAIQRLCPRSILIEQGRAVADGNTSELAARYLASGASDAPPGQWMDLSGVLRRGNQAARFEQVWYSSGEEVVRFQPYSEGPLEVKLKVISDSRRRVKVFAVNLRDQFGTKLIAANSQAAGRMVNLQPGENILHVRIEKLYLNPGSYYLGFSLWDRREIFDEITSAVRIEVIDFGSDAVGFRSTDAVIPCQFEISEEALGPVATVEQPAVLTGA